MKKMIFTLCLILFSSAFFTMGSADVKAAEGAQITISSPSNSVRIGDTFKLQVSGEGFNDLFGVEVALTYDAQALKVQGVAAGEAYDAFDAYTINASEGKLFLPLVRKQLQSTPQATVRLAEITFLAQQVKDAVITIQSVKAVSSERLINAQGYKDLKSLTTGMGDAVTVKIAKQDSTAPGGTPGGNGPSQPSTPSTSTNLTERLNAVLKEKDAVRAAEMLQALLNGMTSEPAAADKEALLKAAASIVKDLSQVAVSQDGTGKDAVYAISADDVRQRDALLHSVQASLSKWNMNAPQISQAQLKAVMVYTLAGRDASKLGVYRYNENAGTWEYVRGAVHQIDAATFTIGVKQAGKYRIQEYVKTYTDTSRIYEEARYAIDVLTARHIVQGTSETLFTPERPVTRAEFSTMIVNALALDQLAAQGGTSGTAYADVAADAWYSPSIKTLRELHIINGFEDGTFRPNDQVTREQMVVIAMNAWKALKPVPDSTLGSGEKFADDAAISGWAKEAVSKARGMNLISGTGQNQFMPKQSSNRADTSVFIWKMLQQLN
ncbi:S-layer homology domain-containing protein [Paenibacillus guangzhouensis]|uniref:S-layer homology domain-containing protein n=1 Tax=Paenibacillus guangzhouensis TaxID=1473112 RepID=UPI00126769B2|nr:S-layer homology domain-containing protein [Paenibacillus guangzhouensis]